MAPIWAPIWTRIQPKIEKSTSTKRVRKKDSKINHFSSKIEAFKIEKHKKNVGGLSKIILFASSQRCRKNEAQTLISERFLTPTSAQYREKVVSKSLLKFIRFLIGFFIDFSSILAPLGDPKVLHFSCIFALVVALAPSWRQEAPQSAPRQPQGSIFYYFLPFWGRF